MVFHWRRRLGQITQLNFMVYLAYNIYVLLLQGRLFLYVLCANSFFRHIHPHCLCPFLPFLRPLIGGRPRLFLIGLIFSNPDNSGANRQWWGQKKNAQKASCLKKLRKLHFATQCRIVSPFKVKRYLYIPCNQLFCWVNLIRWFL